MDRLVPAVVVAFAAGIAAARGLPGPAALAAAAGAAAAAFLLVRAPAVRGRLPPPFDRRVSPALLLLAALAGGGRAALDTLPSPPGSLDRALPRREVPVVLEGIAGEAPRPLPPAPRGDRPSRRESRFRLEVASVLGPEGRVPAPGRALVYLEGEPPDLRPGDRVRVTGLARPAWPSRNPGGWDPGPGSGGPDRVVDAPGPGAVAILARGTGPTPARLSQGLREVLLGAVREAARGRGAALLEGLLAGRREALDPGFVRDLRRSGTYHVLVVSGLHIALLAAGTAWVLRRGGVGPTGAALGATAAAVLYAAASGFGTPALRALVAVSLVALAPLARRRADPVHSLSLAAGLLLAFRPAFLGEPGFQLSFGAVLGLLRLSPALGATLFARRRFLRRFPIPAADRSLRRHLGDLLERGLPPALAAWAATAPILAFHFGTVAPVTPLANLVVVPLVTGMLGAAALLVPLGQVLPEVSAGAADLLAGTLAALVGLLARLPGAWLAVPPPPAWLLAADGALLALAALRPRAGTLGGAGLGLAAVVLAPVALPPRPPGPSLLVLDCGHGLSVLADGGGARVLYDAGGRSARVGERTVLPALGARGALVLDAVLVSHEDTDHTAGVRDLLESARVGLLVVGEGFGRADAGREVLEAAAREGVPVLRAAAGDRLAWPGLVLEVLHPPPGAGPESSDNDGSLVVRVSMEGLSALLPGDVEGPAVRDLLLSGADLRADALLLPHHGSPGVEHLELLAAAVRARVLVASAGPSTAAVDRVASPFAPRLLSTADEGSILVTPEGAGPVR